MKKKWFLYVTVLFIAALLFIGCPEAEEDEPTPTPEPVEQIVVFDTEIVAGATLVTDFEADVSSGAEITTYESEDVIAVFAYNNTGTDYENRMRINFDPALDLTGYQSISLSTNMDNDYTFVTIITTDGSSTARTLCASWHGTQTGWFNQEFSFSEAVDWDGFVSWAGSSQMVEGIEFYSDKSDIDTTAYVANILLE